MKLRNRLTALFSALILLLASCTSSAQTDQKKPAGNNTASIQVLQFHLEHRCVTCRKIEVLTKETLAKYFKDTPFQLVNVEDKKNEKISLQFQAAGTALYLYNPKTGKKKDLTEFAFMTAGNGAKFEKELKQQIESFVKS